jgi:hypothetical protein
MSKPRHGTLDISTDSNWYFYPGKSKEGILLPDLSANCQHLMDTAQLFYSEDMPSLKMSTMLELN